MKKLSKDLKSVLTGLTCQNAGEFLSRREKVKTLEKALDNALDNGVLSSHSRSTVDTQLIQKDKK